MRSEETAIRQRAGFGSKACLLGAVVALSTGGSVLANNFNKSGQTNRSYAIPECQPISRGYEVPPNLSNIDIVAAVLRVTTSEVHNGRMGVVRCNRGISTVELDYQPVVVDTVSEQCVAIGMPTRFGEIPNNRKISREVLALCVLPDTENTTTNQTFN